MATNLFNFGPVLDQVLANTKTLVTNTQQLLTNLAALKEEEDKEMATLDDLTKAVADVQAAVQTAVTLIQTLHTGTGTVTDAEVEDAVTQLEAAAAALGGAKPQP